MVLVMLHLIHLTLVLLVFIKLVHSFLVLVLVVSAPLVLLLLLALLLTLPRLIAGKGAKECPRQARLTWRSGNKSNARSAPLF